MTSPSGAHDGTTYPPSFSIIRLLPLQPAFYERYEERTRLLTSRADTRNATSQPAIVQPSSSNSYSRPTALHIPKNRSGSNIGSRSSSTGSLRADGELQTQHDQQPRGRLSVDDESSAEAYDNLTRCVTCAFVDVQCHEGDAHVKFVGVRRRHGTVDTSTLS